MIRMLALLLALFVAGAAHSAPIDNSAQPTISRAKEWLRDMKPPGNYSSLFINE